ncbi:sensor domain-containing phosphodiesterase [Cognatiyoonia koreensis]|uniref:sensor domain-containing phosphodiesterase n=1 Tax=Cognatiyoonia koreensis TaxID=364200 RepID=UPI000B7D4D0E|nr:EAL domain-containing protein [Cognatiyoonia koreensis]
MAGFLYPGAIHPLREMLCAQFIGGDLPQLVPDTAMFPALERVQFYRDAEIGALICVPIHHADGQLYGVFTCFAHQAIPTLSARDLEVVRMFAELAQHAINKEQKDYHNKYTLERQMNGVIHQGGLNIYLQPIVSLSSRTVRAVEALSRFNAPGNHSVEWWFAQAGRANMQVALEIAAIERALDILPEIPAPIYLSVNVSPATVAAPAFLMALRHAPADRVIIELTEHQEIANTAELMRTPDVLRKRRIRIAIDDVGAGYSGLNTILRLKPNVMKLDRRLVMDIHLDTAKQSLASALVYFASQETAFLIAEGVEQPEEHKALRKLGVRLGQGFLYARPAPAADQINRIMSAGTQNVIQFPSRSVI